MEVYFLWTIKYLPMMNSISVNVKGNERAWALPYHSFTYAGFSGTNVKVKENKCLKYQRWSLYFISWIIAIQCQLFFHCISKSDTTYIF